MRRLYGIVWLSLASTIYACDMNENEVHISAYDNVYKTWTRPVLLKDKSKQMVLGAFAGSGTFLATKGKEKIYLEFPEGQTFTTESVCVLTKDVKHVVLEWQFEKEEVFKTKLWPTTKEDGDEACYQPDPADTMADRMVMKFRRSKEADESTMLLQKLEVILCIPVPASVTAEAEDPSEDDDENLNDV